MTCDTESMRVGCQCPKPFVGSVVGSLLGQKGSEQLMRRCLDGDEEQ